MRRFFSSTDNTEVLNGIYPLVEKYRARLIGEAREFDLESFIRLAKLKKQKLEKNPKQNKEELHACKEYIKLAADELKLAKNVMRSKPENLEVFNEALFSIRSKQRLERMNHLSDTVLGNQTDVRSGIAKDKKLNAKLNLIKNKMSAVIILINILDCQDENVAKISQIALHAKNTATSIKDKEDHTWMKFWKSLEDKAKPLDVEKALSRFERKR